MQAQQFMVAHVVPVDDLIGHTAGLYGDCVCGPTIVPARAAEVSWVYVHHSLDGREFTEEGSGGA